MCSFVILPMPQKDDRKEVPARGLTSTSVPSPAHNRIEVSDYVHSRITMHVSPQQCWLCSHPAGRAERRSRSGRVQETTRLEAICSRLLRSRYQGICISIGWGASEDTGARPNGGLSCRAAAGRSSGGRDGKKTVDTVDAALHVRQGKWYCTWGYINCEWKLGFWIRENGVMCRIWVYVCISVVRMTTLAGRISCAGIARFSQWTRMTKRRGVFT